MKRQRNENENEKKRNEGKKKIKQIYFNDQSEQTETIINGKQMAKQIQFIGVQITAPEQTGKKLTTAQQGAAPDRLPPVCFPRLGGFVAASGG